MWLDGEFDLVGEDLTVVQRAEKYVSEMEEAVGEISLNRIRAVSSAAESLQIALRHPDEFVRALFEEGATLARLLQNSVTNLSIDFLPKGMKEALADTDILDTHQVPMPKNLEDTAAAAAAVSGGVLTNGSTHGDEPAVFHRVRGALGENAAGSDVRNAQPYFHPHQEDDFSLDEWASVREFGGDNDVSHRHHHHKGGEGEAEERVRYVAVYRYDAGHSDELSVARDEVLHFHGPQPGEALDEWVQVENSYGDIGAVPVAVLKKVEAVSLVPRAALQQGPGFEPVSRAPQELQQVAAETRVRTEEHEAAVQKQQQEAEAEASPAASPGSGRKKKRGRKKGGKKKKVASTEPPPPASAAAAAEGGASPNVATIKTRRRVFDETQVRLTVMYPVRTGDSTHKNCITANRGDELIGIAKDGVWWRCVHVADEANAKAEPATFIPDSYVQVNVITVQREVVEAVGADAAAEQALLVNLDGQSEYEARLKKQEEDLASNAAQLERVKALAREQEERADRAERERQRVAQEKKELDASLRQREEARSQEAQTYAQKQAQLQRQQDALDKERRRMQEERDALEAQRRDLAATQREQREKAAELRSKAQQQQQQDDSPRPAPDAGINTPAATATAAARKKPAYRSPMLAHLKEEEDDDDATEAAAHRKTEQNLLAMLAMPEGSHLVDVHLSPGSMGCVVVEEQLNGVAVVVIDELRPTAQPGLRQGDVIAAVNGTSTIGRDTDFFADLIQTPTQRCVSVLRRGSRAGMVPNAAPAVGSTYEVHAPPGSLGVSFRGVGGDVVVEAFSQASPLRKSGQVWVGDRLVAVCGDDVRSRGHSYAIQKILQTQHMADRVLVLSLIHI